MDEERERSGQEPSPFPGDGFWKGLEGFLSALGLASPRLVFRLRATRAAWEERRSARRNLERGVGYTHKACPACGRLVNRGVAVCASCGARTRWAPGPGLARTLGFSIPHGSVAMTLVTVNLIFFAIAAIASSRSAGTDLLGSVFEIQPFILYKMGSLWVPGILKGEVWRLWTYQFLHGGLLHIGFNLYAMLSVGPLVEDTYGPSKMITLTWIAGLGGGIASAVMKTLLYGGHGTSVGISGALFGLIGLLIGHSYRRGGRYGASLRSPLLTWAGMMLVFGFLFPRIDNAAHIGGLLTGLLSGLVVGEDEPREGAGALLWRLAAFFVVGLTLYGFVTAALTA